MRAVVDPESAGLNELTGRDHRRMTDDGDQVSLAPGLDAQHAKAVLRVVEGHAVDQAGQDLGRGACSCCFGHYPMMRITALGRYLD